MQLQSEKLSSCSVGSGKSCVDLVKRVYLCLKNIKSCIEEELVQNAQLKIIIESIKLLSSTYHGSPNVRNYMELGHFVNQINSFSEVLMKKIIEDLNLFLKTFKKENNNYDILSGGFLDCMTQKANLKDMSTKYVKNRQFIKDLFMLRCNSKNQEELSIGNKLYECLCEIYKTRTSIGKYTWKERLKRIIKFKIKKIKRTISRPKIKKYLGRSLVATKKLRYKGKFIKATMKNKKQIYFKVKNN